MHVVVDEFLGKIHACAIMVFIFSQIKSRNLHIESAVVERYFHALNGKLRIFGFYFAEKLFKLSFGKFDGISALVHTVTFFVAFDFFCERVILIKRFYISFIPFVLVAVISPIVVVIVFDESVKIQVAI